MVFSLPIILAMLLMHVTCCNLFRYSVQKLIWHLIEACRKVNNVLNWMGDAQILTSVLEASCLGRRVVM